MLNFTINLLPSQIETEVGWLQEYKNFDKIDFRIDLIEEIHYYFSSHLSMRHIFLTMDFVIWIFHAYMNRKWPLIVIFTRNVFAYADRFIIEWLMIVKTRLLYWTLLWIIRFQYVRATSSPPILPNIFRCNFTL